MLFDQPSPDDSHIREESIPNAPAANDQQQTPRPMTPNGMKPLNPVSRGKKKKKKHHSLGFMIFKKIVTVIATTLLSLFLVMIITGTIVATALTVYVLDFMDDSTTITFQALEMGSDTIIYGTELDESGEEKLVKLKQIKSSVQRIPIKIEKVPQHVRNAFVYTEDERFYVHDGVDYKRTFSAFLNMFMHFYDTNQGGSTITQQLIKNLTGDTEQSPQRKIREIFSAMQLEKTYSKDEILEEYLNYISFGGAVNGIELACIRYFGKSVDQISIPEAAVLAAIPKDPERYGPMQWYHEDELDISTPLISDGRANNTVRQKYVLYKMYENGAITYDEYQEYLETPIIYTDSEEYLKDHPEDAAELLEKEKEVQSWALDAIYFEAINYFMEEMDIEFDTALDRINTGGYKIYTHIDNDMQNYVEEKFKKLENLVDPNWVQREVDIDGKDGVTDDERYPHVAFVALDYDGSVKATIGNWGEKKVSLGTNYAVRDKRSIGSTIKPITTYGLGLETDHIHWSSKYTDKAVETIEGQPWPSNYSVGPGVSISGRVDSIYFFLQQSYNTVPAQLCKELTPHEVYKFVTEKLGVDLDPSEELLAPLSIGSMRYGMTLQDLVNAYLPYGNQGVFNDAHIITKIEDSNGNVVMENNGNPRDAVSSETAWVMNRMLKNVVDRGTAASAKLNNKVLVGKTGTNENWWDNTFVGLTKDFVSGVTIGYKQYRMDMQLPTNLHACDIWKRIIGEYAETRYADTGADFEPDKNVIESYWCTTSGKIAGPGCPKSSMKGYWKSTNHPTCEGGHYTPPKDEKPKKDENANNNGGGNNGGEAAPPADGGGNNGGEASPPADGGGNNGGEAAPPADGGGNNGGEAAPPADGGGNNGGEAAPPADGGGNNGGEAAPPADGGGNNGGEAAPPADGGGNNGGEAAPPADGGGNNGGEAAAA